MQGDSFKASSSMDDRPGPGNSGASQRHDWEEGELPGIVVTGPEVALQGRRTIKLKKIVRFMPLCWMNAGSVRA